MKFFYVLSSMLPQTQHEIHSHLNTFGREFTLHHSSWYLSAEACPLDNPKIEGIKQPVRKKEREFCLERYLIRGTIKTTA